MFKTEACADRWLDEGKAAIRTGHSLPVPPPAELVESSRANRGTGTPFVTMATAWQQERYEEIRMGGPGRETTVSGHVRRTAAWMKENNLFLETMTRSHVKAFQASLTRVPGAGAAPTVPEGLDPDDLVTKSEAVRLPGMASLATLKRRIADGTLVAVDKASGAHRFRLGDLYAEDILRTAEGGLRRGPRGNGVLSQDVANDVVWVFNEVCLFAEDHGVVVPQDRKSLDMHRTDKKDKRKRQPVSFSQCADVAARLHTIHQIALWLMRVLGLRISEAYGIKVGRLIDCGPGQPGVLLVKAQGGKPFTRIDRRTGERTVSGHVEDTKTVNSYRGLVVPPALMSLLRTVVAIFHTDASGAVRHDARLIPGLKVRDAGGQAAFTAALASAAAGVGIDCTAEEEALDDTFSCTPHDMRRSVLSDLDRWEVKGSHAKRFAGHAAGADVHHRHYVLDDPKLRPAKKIAKLLEKELAAEVPGGLIIPTMVRCTTRSDGRCTAGNLAGPPGPHGHRDGSRRRRGR